MEPPSSSSNDKILRKCLKPGPKRNEQIRRAKAFSCLKPDPTNEQIVQAIASTYNHEPSNVRIRKELDSYDDRNYLIEIKTQEESGNGNGTGTDAVVTVTKYLCKVYNGVESAEYIECSKDENVNRDDKDKALSPIHLYSRIWNHVNQSKYGVTTSSPIPIPIPIPNNNISQVHASIHELPVTSKSHSPARLVLQLLQWVEGRTLESVSASASLSASVSASASANFLLPIPIETFVQAGTYLAKICTALDDLTHEDAIAKKTADRYHAWDGRNILDVQDLVHCIEDEKRRGMVQSVLDAFRLELMEEKDDDEEEEEEEGEENGNIHRPKFRMGILHGDFHGANILLDGDGNVSGVIDFGDTILSWRILDLTVAMAHAMMTPSYSKTGRSISAAAAVLRGFHSQYPLTKDERKYLRLLIACRLSCAATRGAYSYQLNPQNQYLLLHSEPAWGALELVWGSSKSDGSVDAIESIFNAACDG